MKIKGTELDTVIRSRCLGINIDTSLDWKEHLKIISSKVSRVIGFLKHARNFIPKIQRKHSTQVLQSRIFVAAVPFGAAAGKQILANCKSYKI